MKNMENWEEYLQDVRKMVEIFHTYEGLSQIKDLKLIWNMRRALNGQAKKDNLIKMCKEHSVSLLIK